MITGVLAAHAGGDFFNNAVLDLQAIADTPVQEANDVGEVRLPQVHALNCLKDIFADTRLGPSTEPYVADSLDIAACCLDSAAYVSCRHCQTALTFLLQLGDSQFWPHAFQFPNSSFERWIGQQLIKDPEFPSIIFNSSLREISKPASAHHETAGKG